MQLLSHKGYNNLVFMSAKNYNTSRFEQLFVGRVIIMLLELHFLRLFVMINYTILQLLILECTFRVGENIVVFITLLIFIFCVACE